MTIGMLSFAPIYLNGLLALFCVFMLPGLVFVRAIGIPNFSQRILVILLASLTANYLIVILIAALHLEPLGSYRCLMLAMVTALVCLTIMDVVGRRAPFGLHHHGAVVEKSDLAWLALALVIVCLAYFNIWRGGVPKVFGEGDISASWNPWAMIWSHGLFPSASGGYPQFIPTLWAVTYIFTGSDEHYFAYYVYLELIIAPLVLVSTYLSRRGWLWALLPVLTFAWFVAEIQEGWLRATLEAGFPDWTAALAGYCGIVLFITNDPGTGFDRQKIVTALASECLILLAAATKPIYGLMAAAILIRICIDGVVQLKGKDRTRFLAASIGLFAAFAIAYLTIYLHLTIRFMPNYPVAELAERLSRGAALFNRNFSWPFRIAACLGIAISPFIPRVRWLTLPLLLGTWLWIDKAGYDLRNLFGVLLTGVFITLFVAVRAVASRQPAAAGPRWRVPDAVTIGVLMIVAVVSTHTVAQDDAHLRQRFARDQLGIGAGAELNQKVLDLYDRGCFILSAAGYFYTMGVFQKYRPQMIHFYWYAALPDETIKAFTDKSGCTAILYPTDISAAQVLSFIKAASEERHFVSVAQSNGWVLLAAGP